MEPFVEGRFAYQEYVGPYIKHIASVKQNGEMLIDPVTLLQKRLDSPEDFWRDNHVTTSDFFAYHPDGGVKSAQDILSYVDPKLAVISKRGGIVLDEEVYDSLDVEEYTREALSEFPRERLPKNRAQLHPLWRDVAQDEFLLESYSDFAYELMESRWHYTTGMGVYLAEPSNVIEAFPVTILSIGNWSGLLGDIGVRETGTRVVGSSERYRGPCD